MQQLNTVCVMMMMMMMIIIIISCGPGQLSQYGDSLRVGRSGDRIPLRTRFLAPFHTGHGAHPASYTMGTVSFPGAKRPERDADPSPPSSTEVKKRVVLYLYSTSGPSWPVLGWTLPLRVIIIIIIIIIISFYFYSAFCRHTMCNVYVRTYSY